jgi:Flp pilus assembly pilin Flp
MKICRFVDRFRRLCVDTGGQDMVEYALLAAGIAVAAGALVPQAVQPSINTILSKVVSCLTVAGSY